VTLDGREPGASHGVDVDGDGQGVIAQPRLHQLIRVAGAVRERTAEIVFRDPGVQLCAFTFG